MLLHITSNNKVPALCRTRVVELISHTCQHLSLKNATVRHAKLWSEILKIGSLHNTMTVYPIGRFCTKGKL